MKLYLLSQTVNDDYDTYDSCVVCANSEEDAKTIHPDGSTFPIESPYNRSEWAVKLSEVNAG